MRAIGRTSALVATALLVAALGVAVSWWRAPDDDGLARGPRAAGDVAQRDATPEEDEPPPGVPRPATGAATGAASSADPTSPDPFGEEYNGWASVDLDAVRKALPDNVYWTLSAPTKDPDELRRRADERARWNTEYGKILSNTATEEEIQAYYAERDRIYSDYIAFATYILENHGRDLSLRDVGLLKVAVELNLARLEEIPRQMREAQERSKAHAAAREAWLRDQAEFAGTPPPSSP
jgi:hypothetical protein